MEKIIADYSTKLTQSILFLYKCDTILGIRKDRYDTHKEWYKKKLIKYDLWDDTETDLIDL